MFSSVLVAVLPIQLAQLQVLKFQWQLQLQMLPLHAANTLMNLVAVMFTSLQMVRLVALAIFLRRLHVAQMQ
mgnify:CR=1 FL=1